MPLRESPPPPTTAPSTKRRRRVIGLAIAVILWYVIFVLIRESIGDAFIYGEKPGIFWLALNQITTLRIAICAPVAAVMLSLLIPGFLTAKYPHPILILAILIALFLAILTMVGPNVNRVHHIQTLRYRDHIYYLADRVPREGMTRRPYACMQDAKPGCVEWDFSHEYLVYQCGPLGVVCQGIAYEVFDEQLYKSHGGLYVDAEGSINLEVNGLWIWSYPTGDQ